MIPFLIAIAAALTITAVLTVQDIRAANRAARKPRRVCAWCEPGVSGQYVTHGLCEKHKRELMEEAEKASVRVSGYSDAKRAELSAAARKVIQQSKKEAA